MSTALAQRPARLLQVEDNPADQELTRLGMERSGLCSELTVFETAEEALQHLLSRSLPARELPDLLLLDLNLPGMSGHDLLREIRANPDLTHLVVVILSTSEAEEDVMGSYRNHVNAYVHKPIGLDDFGHLVETIEQFWFGVVRLPGADRPMHSAVCS